MNKEQIINKGLKSELINIFALTHGYNLDNSIKHQIMIFKKKNLTKDVPYLLYPQSTTKYIPSLFGQSYMKSFSSCVFYPKYVAYIHTKISFRFRNEVELFENLFLNDHFVMWNSSEPMKYFYGYNNSKVYALILKIYKINDNYNENIIHNLAMKSRQSAIFNLGDYKFTIDKPVIDHHVFENQRNEIIQIFNSNYCVLGIEEFEMVKKL